MKCSLNIRFQNTEPQVEHVKAERNVLAEVHSPYVVKLFFSFPDEEYLYLVMEYLPGGGYDGQWVNQG